MGSFFTELNIPDLKKYPVKLSSIVLASQRIPASAPRKGSPADPLILDGQQWLPNIAHVFRPDQHLYLLYDVYDPTKVTAHAQPANTSNTAATGNIRVLTSIEFLSGSTKVFETPQVQATQLTNPATGDLAFQFDLPLTDLKPGTYICQINVIDDAGGSFSFPRTALLIKPTSLAPAATALPSSPAASQ
jgi:hypothetical protein